MLVLTRKLNEQIQIGNDITLTIVRIKGNTVRLGIEAPRKVRVIRAELPPDAKERSNLTLESDTTPRAMKESPDEDPRRTAGEAPGKLLPLRLALQELAAKKAAEQKHVMRSKEHDGHAASDDAIAALRLNPRRRAPGEKPAVLPRLPRLAPASPYTNRLAAYDPVAVLLE